MKVSKKKVVLGRRRFLRGAGGVALGLPLLPSLVPGRAWAQEVVFDAGPRFVSICSNHGGLDESAMFPQPTGPQVHTQFPGMDIRRADLVRMVSGDRASVSPVLSAPAASLSERLVSKMNVLQGLDIPFYIAHHTGGHLGNFARNDGNGGDGQQAQLRPMPTIDQLMAWSSDFYADLGGVTSRSLLGGAGRLSWNYSNPASASGDIQEVRGSFDAREAFDRVFPSGVPSSAPRRRPIVDLVVDSYRSLRNGHRRLSVDDRQRLDDHMDRLAELQRRLAVGSLSCQDVSAPDRTAVSADNFRNLVDVVTAAFACGATKVAVLGIHEADFVPYSGDWHQDVAHQHQNPGPQASLVQANQAAFERVVLALATRLDQLQEVPGQSVLDNTLVAWSQESGPVTHEARSIPVVTFGGAGGFFRTGQHCDYRNLAPQGMRMAWGREQGASGLLYAQWLATCLHAMGMPRATWQNVTNNGATGYGLDYIDEGYQATHVPGVVESASDVLAFLAAR